MYNIHSHYENIFAYLKTKVKDPVLLYFNPFGSIDFENLEHLHCNGDGSSPIFLCYDQEPILPSTEKLFLQVRQHYNRYRPIIVLNTDYNSITKKDLFAKYDLIDAYYFFHIFAAADWYRGYKYCSELVDPGTRKINKKFITFNRLTGSARSYRSIFVGELCNNNLLHHGHVSFSHICPEHGHYQQQLLNAVDNYQLDRQYIKSIVDSIGQIKSPLRIDYKDQAIENGSQVLNAIPELMESFLHVVTETCFWDTRGHLTEKIFKPIVARQPFVLIGCANNLTYLKKYGFKTFNAWWDESYDSIQDPVERIQAVVKIIQDICSMPNDDLEAMLRGMKYTLDYNYNLFFSEDFVNDHWNNLKYQIDASILDLVDHDLRLS